ncbi:AraC family transcriptional regulator [Alteribacter natronophilus]|uniref:AraC family transcriptional regulator n=1 Tax=Alteribacter natronophilus TaxID=2583810 RepID=UPI00110F655C|nr:AraC family transcriptional regulator [Alteribacter natronophilus]TMW72893.1 AraC family transcriptional regulator [Alteribacter natronophilus]
MEWVASLRRTIDYIEECLPEPVSVDQAAKAAHVSPAHLQRAFSVLTGISLGEYIRRRRLTLAAEELSRGKAKILDTALRYGYETPESFAKAFRRQHGITPKEARKPGAEFACYNRLVIQVTLKGEKPMKYRMVERESFNVAGIKKRMTLENNAQQTEIPKLWGKVNADGTSEQLFRLNQGQIDGVLGVCIDQGNQEMDYWVATEYEGALPEQFDQLTIPASTWAVFEVHGPMPDAMQKAWEQIMSEWFPSSSYEHAGTPDFEKYTDEDPACPDLYSEIWIPVK